MGGGTPILSFIFMFGALFLVQIFRKVILTKSDFFFFFFFFLGGGGGGSFLYILGLFKVKILFWSSKISNNFGYARYSLFFFYFFFFLGGGGRGWGSKVDAGSKPMYEEKLRVPPGVSLGTDLSQLGHTNSGRSK